MKLVQYLRDSPYIQKKLFLNSLRIWVSISKHQNVSCLHISDPSTGPQTNVIA